MKTNIEFVNNTYAVAFASALFLAGRDEDGNPVIGDCELYRDLNGNTFAYSVVSNEVVEDYGDVVRYDSRFQHWCGNKRGHHSNSNNKKAARHAATKKILDDLPF